ncbi:MAG: hypothetical protein OSA93_16765, partial [Akkermansiaceae bacterium]|nr:hypothetical protein [Akkermansiaceae bacterium]
FFDYSISCDAELFYGFYVALGGVCVVFGFHNNLAEFYGQNVADLNKRRRVFGIDTSTLWVDLFHS